MKIILCILLIIIIFLYGLLVGKKQFFPYSQLVNMKNLLMGGESYSVQKWDKTYSQHYYNRKSQFDIFDNKMNNKIVMLGDSLTEHGNWNELLSEFKVFNRGISGDTVDGLYERLYQLDSTYSKAFVMIGINDFSKAKSVQNVYDKYIKIIHNLVSKNIKPFIQSTIYTGIERSKLHNENVEKLNQLLLNYCKKNNLTYINLNNQLSSKKLLKDEFSFDGLHLNGKAYNIWAEQIKIELER